MTWMNTIRAPLTALCLLIPVGCDDAPAEDDAGTNPTVGTESDDGSSGDEPTVGALEVGFGELQFEPLQDGGDLRFVWGAQGSAMFPMPVRGSEFTLPDDPRDYTDERAPLLDVELDVDGTEPGYCGHFKCVSNYPLSFEILEDGTYEFLYVRVIVPDGIDPRDIEGRAAHLRVELSPYDSAPLVQEFDLTVVVDAPPV